MPLHMRTGAGDGACGEGLVSLISALAWCVRCESPPFPQGAGRVPLAVEVRLPHTLFVYYLLLDLYDMHVGSLSQLCNGPIDKCGLLRASESLEWTGYVAHEVFV
jgi:hypothetical protein